MLSLFKWLIYICLFGNVRQKNTFENRLRDPYRMSRITQSKVAGDVNQKRWTGG